MVGAGKRTQMFSVHKRAVRGQHIQTLNSTHVANYSSHFKLIVQGPVQTEEHFLSKKKN